MFKSSNGFSGFSIDDVDAAREFYGRVLGLSVSTGETGILEITLPGGSRVMAYPKPNHEPATYTMLNFLVTDIEAAVDELVAAGVTMERYDLPDMPQDAKGIVRSAGRGPDIAWFKDPAGNIIALIKE